MLVTKETCVKHVCTLSSLRINRDSSWCEFDRGLAQVTQVKTKQQRCIASYLVQIVAVLWNQSQMKNVLVFNASHLLQFLLTREIWLRELFDINHIYLLYKWSWSFYLLCKQVGKKECVLMLILICVSFRLC